jgi:hypothetical protein
MNASESELCKSEQKKNDEMSEEHDLPKAWNNPMMRPLTFIGEEGAVRD